MRKYVKTFQDKGVSGSASKFIKKHFIDKKYVAPYSRRFNKILHEQFRAYPEIGYWPNVRQPRSFNEKVLHRMLVENNELYTISTDKVSSREYVSKKMGDSILPEAYCITDDPGSIPFESLPKPCVIKSNFGSGQLIILNEGDEINTNDIIKKCNHWLSKDYHLEKAIIEGNYNFDYELITPQILIEEKLIGKHQTTPRDYKFYVFSGKVEYIHVDFNRFEGRSMRFFNRDWVPQTFQKGNNPLGPIIDQPEEYEQMIEIAESLGENFDFIRVDLYNTRNNGVVFGELTPNPGAGKSPFSPRDRDFEFGNLWKGD